MRVVHLIDSGGVYGTERVLFDLIGALNEIGVQSEITSMGEASEDKKPIECECERLGIAFRPVRFSPGYNILEANRVLGDIESAGFDLMHAHGYKPDVLFGLFLHSRRKLPMITTVHGWTEMRRFSSMGIYQALDRLSWRYIDRIIAVSDSSPAYMSKRLLGKVTTIENGITQKKNLSADTIANVRNSIRNFRNVRTCIGVVSRLSKEKGINVLIEAIATLKTDNEDICLVIVGDGEEASRLKYQISINKLDDHILMTGYVNSASHLIDSFDILAIPSFTEGLPVTLLEAMLSGVPVVATAVGQIPYVLDNGKCGVIVDAGNPDELAKGIMMVVRDHYYRNALVECATERLKEKYTSEVMARKYKSVYKEVISNAASA